MRIAFWGPSSFTEDGDLLVIIYCVSTMKAGVNLLEFITLINLPWIFIFIFAKNAPQIQTAYKKQKCHSPPTTFQRLQAQAQYKMELLSLLFFNVVQFHSFHLSQLHLWRKDLRIVFSAFP